MKASESLDRGPGENRPGPCQASFNPSEPPPYKLDSSGPLQCQHLFQVVTLPFEPEVIVIRT